MLISNANYLILKIEPKSVWREHVQDSTGLWLLGTGETSKLLLLLKELCGDHPNIEPGLILLVLANIFTVKSIQRLIERLM
jgi:hypothetical protein